MTRHSSVEALGDPSLVHLLEVELSSDVLGGTRAADAFDGERIREAANLLKRVCTKQKVAGDYAVSGVRAGNISVRCGFLDVRERDLIGDLGGAVVLTGGPWATRRYILLDPASEALLSDAGTPRDNSSAGRRARDRARKAEDDRGLRWKVRGDM
jgi:hypothetical protein